ncbi:MAG TPA: tetratricopeptide repeat-containing protein, partial [Cyanothece sp. UBA12306]|nr:tetratricopeptide repeat-containing protein [Cyanothece sp. UBA12306]
RYTEAEPLYLQAIQICEKILGKDHPWTITAQQNYRKMLEEKDR